jgi:hypothetical protein
MSILITDIHPIVRLTTRTVIRRRNGQTLQVKIPEPLMRDYDTAKRRLYLLSAHNLSQSIVVRRALDLYLKKLSSMSDEQAQSEAEHMIKNR